MHLFLGVPVLIDESTAIVAKLIGTDVLHLRVEVLIQIVLW